MKDVVTFETALRLKEAGFPQPEGKAGQFWYGKKNAGNSDPGSLCVLIGGDTGDLRFTPLDGKENANNKFFVFAPSDSDIMRELKRADLFLAGTKHFVQYYSDHSSIANINPAEAAAQAWLSVNEKQSEQ